MPGHTKGEVDTGKAAEAFTGKVFSCGIHFAAGTQYLLHALSGGIIQSAVRLH
jgi:hypothetical protein